MPFWLAQAVAITVLAVFSYFANSRFAFRKTDG
jgi:putative flippase GtrA